MRQTLEHLRLARHPALLFLGMAGPVFVFLALTAPDCLEWGWFFGALGFLGAVCCLLMPGRRRALCGVLEAAAIVGAGLALLPWRGQPALMLVPFLDAGLLLACLPMAAWEPRREIPIQFCLTLLAFFVVFQIFASAAAPGMPLSRAQTPVQLCFAGFALFLLLGQNREALAQRGQAPLRVRHRNTLLTVGICALVLLIALIPVLAQALAAVAAFLRRMLWELMELLGRLFPMQTGEIGGGAGGGFAGFGLEEAAEARPDWLLRILTVVVPVALGALLLWGLWRLCRFLFSRLKKLRLWFTRFLHAAGEEWEDTVEDTRQSHETLSRRERARLRRSLRAGTPRERIRARFAELLRRHPEWNRGVTARERIEADQASLYERARYSEHPVTAEEAERFLVRRK